MAQRLTSASTQSGLFEKRLRRRWPTGTRFAAGAGAATYRAMSSAAMIGPSPNSIITVRHGRNSTRSPPMTSPNVRPRPGPENETP